MDSPAAAPPAFRSRAPGKVILLGEHAVVYGFPALAIPLDRGVSAIGRLHSQGPALQTHLEALAGPFGRLAARYPEPRVQVELASDIPLSAGLGSSGALAVALVRLFLQASNQTATDLEVARHADAFEREFHGHPSGVDTTTSACGRPLHFVRGEPPTIREVRIGRLEVVVALAGPRLNTRENVLALRRRYEERRDEVEPVLRRVGALVEEGTAALEAGRLIDLGSRMNENHRALAELRVSSPRLDALCERMRSLGAWGAKLTGAGGGGAAIALHPDPQRLIAALRDEGVECFVSRWDSP